MSWNVNKTHRHGYHTPAPAQLHKLKERMKDVMVEVQQVEKKMESIKASKSKV